MLLLIIFFAQVVQLSPHQEVGRDTQITLRMINISESDGERRQIESLDDVKR